MDRRIPYFKEGGSGILLIPSALGYGMWTRGAVILFEVKLIKVNSLSSLLKLKGCLKF
jgi:FKBP-type peptidyl-prolyl cis-trans isomerase